MIHLEEHTNTLVLVSNILRVEETWDLEHQSLDLFFGKAKFNCQKVESIVELSLPD